MSTGDRIAVVGAHGHTGGFVVKELFERGFEVEPIGRGDPLALAGTAAVINCAGPFAVTAAPVIEAAIEAGVPYVDVAAEIEANIDTLARFAGAPVPVVPAMAFFGGLADLMVSAVAGTEVDEIDVAYGLSGWNPTRGTLAAGAVSRERRNGRRVRFTGGRLGYVHDDREPPVVEWDFGSGPVPVLAGFPMAEVVTVPGHLWVGEIRTYMSVAAARGLAAAAERGAEPETFTVDVRVRAGADRWRVTVGGRDVYAVSAPLAVEAAVRLIDGRFHGPGARPAGAMFDARDFLAALPLTFDIGRDPAGVGSTGGDRLA